MKEAYYFSHDSNARHDPKMTAMRGVYGAEGYGWFWMLIEMMMESSDYKLDMHSKYTFHAFAMQLQGDAKRVEQFVVDCINEYELFKSDGQYFWSDSLLRRMEKRKSISEKRQNAAKKRWSNANVPDKDASALQSTENDGFAEQSGAKESKGKEIESKVNEKKDDDNAYGRVMDFYQRNIGTMAPSQYEYVEDWLKTFDADVLIYAIRRAVDQGVPKWAYVNKTLVAWHNSGAKTLKDCETQVVQFERSKEGRYGKHEGHNDRPTSQSKFASADKNKPFDPRELEELGLI